jgi:pantetheine-phosphate adenylyltransferase
VVGIGVNASKQPMFSVEMRVRWINDVFADDPRIEATGYEGLTVNFCREINAHYILRGIRYVSDFEYEKAIADMNRMLAPDIETVFLTTSPEYSPISSTLVRDVIRNQGEFEMFVPELVHREIMS